MSRCTSFEGLVLKSQIGESAVITDESVVDYSRKEISAAELEKYLKEAEANIYYEKSRDALKRGDYEGVLDNIIEGLKRRNDLETETFRRYFLAVANRFAFFKDRYNKRSGIPQEIKIEGNRPDEDTVGRIGNLEFETVSKEPKPHNLLNRLIDIENQNTLIDAKRVMLNKSLKSVHSQNKSLLEDRKELDFKLVAQLAFIERLEKENKSLQINVKASKRSNASALTQNQRQEAEIVRLNKEVDIYRLKLREISILKKQLIAKDEELKQLKEQTWLQKLFS